MSATILDIARRCGVSPGIVKRVLSDSREEIGEEAARLLISRIEDGKNAPRLPVFVPVELLNGGTVSRVI